jgi:alpha-L-fucosidase 2
MKRETLSLPSSPVIRSLFFFALLVLLFPCGVVAAPADWQDYLSRQDPIWERLPGSWWEAPFLGNGMLGTMIRQDGLQSIRWDVDRADVQEHRHTQDRGLLDSSRLPIGYFDLVTAGKITGGTMRLDLWNAEVTGEIKTTAGTIKFRSLVHANEMIIRTDLERSDGEKGAHFEWHGLEATSPRFAFHAMPAGWEKNPPFVVDESKEVKTCTQPLIAGGETTTAWYEKNEGLKTTLSISVAHTFPANASGPEATNAIEKARDESGENFVAAHRAWWHHFYPASFLTVPDSYWESFYWIQLYKLASATRADRALIDNQGPWLQPTPWPGAWWNLNVELSYWPTVPSNHPELAESLSRHLDEDQDNLIKNVPASYQSDSAGIGVASGQELRSSVTTPSDIPGKGADIGDLIWALNDYWQQYRAEMDDQRLRANFFPLLKRAVTYNLHFLKADSQGVLHMPSTNSPEYGSGPDCTYTLALLRWGLATLIECSDRLHLDDPQVSQWKETLAHLAPYPQDEHGYMIAADLPLAHGHRHFSHLLMVFPLHLVNVDQPGTQALVDQSVSYWQSLGEKKGFSFTGASLLASAYGEGNQALQYLNGLRPFLQPNTLYQEAGPVIETPLSAARALQEMMLQSWEDPNDGSEIIRIFPAMPDSWPEAAFENMRAGGGFQVSAARQSGRTLFVRIKSLAGEPCLIRPGIDGPIHVSAASAVTVTAVKAGLYRLDLRKGEEAILFGGDQPPDLALLPVTAKINSNPWGLKLAKQSVAPSR